MDIETAKAITEIQSNVREIQKDQSEIKADIRDFKNCYPSKDNFNNLEERVVKIEANLSKIVWIVLSAVASAILLLVLK